MVQLTTTHAHSRQRVEQGITVNTHSSTSTQCSTRSPVTVSSNTVGEAASRLADMFHSRGQLSMLALGK